ncbi:MAG: hypothetical protein KIT22_14905 [Verrucomicrobiae bacterium]|nr:hypothetical protein [Verrucomicrobiae bacterium]
MRAFPIEVEADGRLRLPPKIALPANAHLAVLVLKTPAEANLTAVDIARLAEAGGAFDFLREEPECYTDADIEPGHHNPDFAGDGPAR